MEAVLAGLLSGATAATIVTWLAKTLIQERLTQAVRHEYAEKLERHRAELQAEFGRQIERLKADIRADELVAQTKWNTKRDACLGALEVVDGVYSHTPWNMPVKPVPQQVDTAQARAAYNKLALACDTGAVLDAFMTALGMRAPNAPPQPMTADLVVDLRNAIRKELGFGEDLRLSREKAWIARLVGDPNRPEGAA